MPRTRAIARTLSPLSRLRVAFWLFLALLLTLAALIQLGHTITISDLGADAGYTLVSADRPSDGDCIPHGGIMTGSHCCSVSCCGAAIANAPTAASPFVAETTKATVNEAAAHCRAPSPFFHPPKLIVQA